MKNVRDRLLDAAEELIGQQGIHATGIDTILARAGTAKMSLYNQFGSKEGLVVAMLERRGERWLDWLKTQTEARGACARARILILFDLIGEQCRSGEVGCPFAAAAGEHADPAHPVHAVAVRHKAEMRRYLAALCRAAGIADAERLARQIQLLIEGATVTALIEGCPEAAKDARAAAECLIAAAGAA